MQHEPAGPELVRSWSGIGPRSNWSEVWPVRNSTDFRSGKYFETYLFPTFFVFYFSYKNIFEIFFNFFVRKLESFCDLIGVMFFYMFLRKLGKDHQISVVKTARVPCVLIIRRIFYTDLTAPDFLTSYIGRICNRWIVLSICHFKEIFFGNHNFSHEIWGIILSRRYLTDHMNLKLLL